MESNNRELTAEKHYYAIGEVAKMFNMTVSNIRFWENEFEVLKPKKNKKGDRFFTRQDLEYLKLIHHLLKEKGYTLIPLRIFFNEKSLVKMEVGLAKGKKHHDKRESIKQKDVEREMKRFLK